MTETFYDVLEVSENASEREIRLAFRRKAKEWHPDVSNHPDALERFQKIQRAHQVLTDSEERDRYDELGHEAYLEWFDGKDGGTGGPPTSSTGTDASARSGTSRTDEASSRSGSRTGSSSTAGSSAASGASSSRSTASSGSSAGSSRGSASGASSRSGSSGSAGRSTSASSSNAGGRSSAGTSSGWGGSNSSAGSTAGSSAGSGAAPGESGGASTPGGSGGESRGSGPAVAEEAVATEAGRWRNTWKATARDAGGGSGVLSVGWSPWGYLGPVRVAHVVATKLLSGDARVLTVALFVGYPLLVSASAYEPFPLWANAAVALATVAVVGYALTKPVVSLVVFGAWSLLTPLLVVQFAVPLESPTTIVALTVSWVPFVLSVLLALGVFD